MNEVDYEIFNTCYIQRAYRRTFKNDCYISPTNDNLVKLKLKTKLRLFDALIMSAALYASETWTRTVNDSNTIEAFE